MGIGSAWDRVIGLVVQPGVEFGHDHVVDYQPDKARRLSRVIEDYSQMVFEAHSTDYQIPSNLQSLVGDHFAILKVGPALTYALREAYWALDQIELEWVGEVRAVQLRKTVLATMQHEPKYWANYYTSGGTQLALDMQYSLSDRIRYYWAMPGVDDAAARLQQSLLASPPPLTLIMQHLPVQYSAIRREEIGNNPKELVMHKIDEVLLQYSNACAQGTRDRLMNYLGYSEKRLKELDGLLDGEGDRTATGQLDADACLSGCKRHTDSGIPGAVARAR